MSTPLISGISILVSGLILWGLYLLIKPPPHTPPVPAPTPGSSGHATPTTTHSSGGHAHPPSGKSFGEKFGLGILWLVGLAIVVFCILQILEWRKELQIEKNKGAELQIAIANDPESSLWIGEITRNGFTDYPYPIEIDIDHNTQGVTLTWHSFEYNCDMELHSSVPGKAGYWVERNPNRDLERSFNVTYRDNEEMHTTITLRDGKTYPMIFRRKK